jgi:hypothetical protein
MSDRVVFEEQADASLRRLLANDPRFDAIRRSIADRALTMVEKYGRPCPAFPGRNFWVDRPTAPPRLSLRVLIEIGDVRRIWSITSAELDGDQDD